MSQYSIRLKPNWLPTLYPQYTDLTSRLVVTGVPHIQQGIQRRENPFLLTYGEISLTFDNADGFFDPLFDLDKIIGTDLNNLRAPLLHYGQVLFSRREFGRSLYQNIFFGYIDPKTLKFNRDASVCSFTAWGVAKMLEKGNAARVHRFAYLYPPGGLPEPFVLSGYDLTHPAAPPGTRIASGLVQVTALNDQLLGNYTLFTQELRPGNTVTVSGFSQTIKSVESDGAATFVSVWGGPSSMGFTGTLLISGQSDTAFLLSRDPITFPAGPEAATLQLFPGDKFKMVARVLPSDYVEGMDLSELASDEMVVKKTQTIGTGLLITTTLALAEVAADFGQSSMQHLNPWWQGRRYTTLIQLLVDETNAALAAAGYSDPIQLRQEPFSSTTGSPILDLVDELNFPFPSSGIAWAADPAGGPVRAVLHGSGLSGIKKPDFLLDPISAERSFSAEPSLLLFTRTIASQCGGGILYFYSVDSAGANVYSNPAIQFAGGPPIERTLVPQVGPGLTNISPFSRISSKWTVAPTAFSRALPNTLAFCYRVESFELQYDPGANVGGMCDSNPTCDRGFYIGRFSTVNNGANWTLVESLIVRDRINFPGESDEFTIDSLGQSGGLAIFPVGGGRYLYILTNGGRLKPFFYLGSVLEGDNATVAAITGGMQIFTDGTTKATNAGLLSGALFSGSNIFYFEDRFSSNDWGLGTLSLNTANPSIFTGIGTRFTEDLEPGDRIQFASGVGPGDFTVASIQSDTQITLTGQNTGPVYPSIFRWQTVKSTKTPRFWYYDPLSLTMMEGTLVNFPNLSGGDFAHAMIDSSRNKLYIVVGKVLFSIGFIFSAGTLTAISVNTATVDTPNFDPRISPVGGVTRVSAVAWLTGPVDQLQGAVGDTVNYPTAGDALLVGTIAYNYIFSDAFAGIIKIANFSGMSCSTAIEQLVVIPQQAILSGADMPTTADPSGYTPIPTIFLKNRILTTAPTFDATRYAVSSQDELWIIQYNAILVSNPNLIDETVGSSIPAGANINTGAVANDRSFNFDGAPYTVLAARYAGASSLTISNPFIFSTSVAKLVANAFAFQLLIPRSAATVKISDPFLIDGATILEPLGGLVYLKRAPNPYSLAQSGAGTILKINYELENNNLTIEVA